MSTDAPAALQTAATDARTDPVEELAFAPKTGRRAVYEAFTFTRTGDIVRVRNDSHGDEADAEHAYTVELDERDVPTRCTCPAYEYHHAPESEVCKHCVAVALHLPEIADEAADEAAVATDGGHDVIVASDEGEILEGDDDADGVYEAGTCPNGHTFCPVENDAARDDALVCFDCHTEGRAE